jgi:RNA polymerase sigma-70 factor (ECF subfamily)
MKSKVDASGPRTLLADISGKRWEVLSASGQYMAGHMEQALIPGRHGETSEYEGIEEPELVRRLRAPDSAAFLALYERFHRKLFRYLVHMTGSQHESEELLQAVFTTVWEGTTTGMFERFDAGRGTLEGYLLGIARNAARRLIARRGRTVSVDQLESSYGCIEINVSGAGLAAVERRFEMQCLREAVVRLPVEYREAITLCCLQDLSYEDAAKVMNCSLGTVGSRVNRGKALLRKALSVSCSPPHMTSVVEAR